MFATTIAVSLTLAAILLFSATQKLGRSPAVVESYRRVGVAPERLAALAATIATGALGVMAGLLWAPIGVAAAAGLVIYFVAAIAAHARHRDWANLGTPIVLLALASAALALRIVTT